MDQINWQKLKVVIFDVDGTLYNQAKLRRLMMFKLAVYYLMHPRRVKELKLILTYRKQREQNADSVEDNLSEAQYEWAAKEMGIPAEQAKQVIIKWIDQVPLQYLGQYKYPAVDEVFAKLHQKGIKTAIFSDLPVKDKLAAMGLSYDIAVCSMDAEINRLKPSPAGLEYIMRQLNLDIDQCLYIGDRMDRDGAAAAAINMPYLNIDKGRTDFFGDLAEQLN